MGGGYRRELQEGTDSLPCTAETNTDIAKQLYSNKEKEIKCKQSNLITDNRQRQI